MDADQIVYPPMHYLFSLKEKKSMTSKAAPKGLLFQLSEQEKYSIAIFWLEN